MNSGAHNGIPCATYRLQFNSDFDFSAAAAILEYLRELGVTDCYASPLFHAGPSSTHGYDVCGFDRINERLGGEEGFRDFTARLRQLGLGLLLDMVPNHMGNDPCNNWWLDVLRSGTESPYATWFDIDWEAGNGGGRSPGKVLVPVLESRYSEVLEAGKLKIAYEDGIFSLNYHDREFPLSEATTQRLLGSIGKKSGEPGFDEAIVKRLSELNGTPGDRRSFAELDRLIREQHYRLAYWRIAPDEINYRRFFDVTELVSMRMELDEVFEASHKLLLSLVQAGDVTGLRIDHPDGLWNPAQYFRKLRKAGATYVLAEKILTGEETLPQDWPVNGTTGYDFLQRLNALFIDSGNERAFDQVYEEFTGCQADTLPLVIYEAKRLVLENAFRSEVRALAHGVREIARRTRYGVDFTFEELRRAVAELAVCFPVYRTYITEDVQEIPGPDLAAIHEAAASARPRFGDDTAPVDFVESLLLLRYPPDLTEEDRRLVVEFVMHFQQLTGPLMAKGLEDTAFYRFNRFLSLNEVGGEPARFGISPEEFHRYNKRMLQDWPHSLLTTATHDTKRGEDLRARLNVLSEIPGKWNEAIARWSHENRAWKTIVAGEAAPDANDEYFIYQTIVGAWVPEAKADAGNFTERIVACALKSLKESKRHTSWTNQNAQYEEAASSFVRSILAREKSGGFLSDFGEFHRPVACHGWWNSLSQTLLKITSPGVPDFYQGTELWDFNLVDPDNRRPVDYDLRQAMLRELRAGIEEGETEALLADLLSNPGTGRIKMFLIRQALNFRRNRADLFANGEYLPLEVHGTRASHVIAFARRHGGRAAVTIVPRFTHTLMNGGETPPLGEEVWADTSIQLPDELGTLALANTLTGETHRSGSVIQVARVFRHFPLALLSSG
jgi:(1->4)-alpha-D-glucan 1-alpha-D-glucosylmutase